MKARALIENDELKADAFSARPDPAKTLAWRDELYALGFRPVSYELGEKFPDIFRREWQGHDLVVHYLYAVRKWIVKVDSMTAGFAWQNFDEFLWYLNEKIMVANFKPEDT